MWWMLTMALAEPCTLPTPGLSLTDAGVAHARAGKFDQALPCFEQAAQTNQTAMDWTNLGSVHHDMAGMLLGTDEARGLEHVRQSKAAFTKAAALGPLPERAVPLQSGNLVMLGDVGGAIQILDQRLPTMVDPTVREDALGRLGDMVMLPAPSDPAAYEAAFGAGGGALDPYLQLAGQAPEADAGKIREGISKLNQAVGLHPRSWPAWWMLGKGHQALGEHEAAQKAFAKAYALNRWHPDVARELVLSQLALGKASEATASDAIVLIHPRDPTLLGNHALVLLMRGDLPAARSTIDRALAVAPQDPINQQLSKTITAVAAGELEVPSHLSLD